MKKIILFVVIIIVLGVVWYLVAPLFVTNLVDEELPEGYTLPSAEEFDEMSRLEKKETEMRMLKMFEDDEEMVDERMDDSEGTSVVKSGELAGADDFHMGNGSAYIFASGESNLLRLEDLNVTNGPALVVLLSKESNPKDSKGLGEYVKLDDLKGNVGNQNYEIPADIDVSEYNSVVIYCEPFKVVFATAPLN